MATKGKKIKLDDKKLMFGNQFKADKKGNIKKAEKPKAKKGKK